MSNAETVDNAYDLYDPHRPRTVSTAGLGISATVAVCGVLRIMGTPLWQVFLLGLAGVLATVGMVIWTRRVWLRNFARPAAMRQAIASIMKQPLPEYLESQQWRTVRARRYEFGTIREPGPAGRIMVNARFLGRADASEVEEMAEDLARLEGVPYIVKTKKNKPGRLVFIANPEQKQRRNRPDVRGQLEREFTPAAREVFGEDAQINYTWDDSEEGNLLSVEVLDIDKYKILAPREHEEATRRLTAMLPGHGFKYVPSLDRTSAQFLRPLPASDDDAPATPSHTQHEPENRGGAR